VKNIIKDLIKDSLNKNFKGNDIPLNNIEVNLCKDQKFGDYSSNIAMKIASSFNEKPTAIAEKLVESLQENRKIKKVEVVKPGFINFFVSEDSKFSIVDKILKEKSDYGKNSVGNNLRVLVEFVSANPTGPLHVGHGRGAVFGDCLSNMLKESGYSVTKEYYVNDAGKQIDILVVSVLQRYHELIDNNFEFSYEDLYKGDYIWDIAAELHRNEGAKFQINSLIDYKNTNIDLYITKIKEVLSDKKFSYIKKLCINYVLENIKINLVEANIDFDSWFFESSLVEDKSLDRVLEFLKKNNHTYSKDKALWFKSTDYNDEKDRVLVKENQDHTYLATDIAYHEKKIERKYDLSINIWGADHHGYVSRIQGAFQIFSKKKSNLKILLVQFANLYRGKEKVTMSTRSGEFVTLNQLLKEVGKDAMRFFYLTRKSDQHMDFDIELAKSNNNNNPVYYVQYAHARICSIFRQLKKEKNSFSYDKENLINLREEEELNIINKLSSYPDVILSATKKYEPHLITNYVRELAQEVHAYYNKHQILVENNDLRNARLSLMEAAKYVFQNSAKIIGIEMPEKM
tara:strand:+ start:2345 stop:4057 length:1713 start_codon:yes stop_codon:yes gene_type:complete